MFVLWLWLALPENKPVYCWALFCCGSGPFFGTIVVSSSVVFVVVGNILTVVVVVAIDASALLFKTYACLLFSVTVTK